MKNILMAKLVIAVLTMILVIPVVSPMQTTLTQTPTTQPQEPVTNQLSFVEPGPTVQSTLYADGSMVDLQTERRTWAILGDQPAQTTLEEFKDMVRSHENTLETVSIPQGDGDGSRTGLDVQFDLSNPPGGATTACTAIETYLETLFNDPIAININIGWYYEASYVLGYTQSNYAGSVTWTNTRNGLINGMDPDDIIQNWLPSGAYIPVSYTYPTGTPTNEGRCFFTYANYRSTIGTISGDVASIMINTYYPWDYDPSNGVSGYCFRSVLAHEIGHALGFTSGVDFRTNDIEALDIYRFQRTDGSGDFNPDTLAEFQTKTRLAWLDTGGTSSDDANSDLITAEYRMSDGNPNQASHFSQGYVDGIMQPAFGSGETFYPDYYRTSDKNMFDAIGWDYSAEGGTTTLPFSDTFPTTTIDRTLWIGLEGATIDDVGLNEPSSPYSLNLDGSAGGGEKIRTGSIDTRYVPEIKFSYYYERKGGGDAPESGDDLIVEYFNNAGQWIQIDRFYGSGTAMTNYQFVSHKITAVDALHMNFRIQFRCVSNQVNLDDWFVDDVLINRVYYTLTTQIEGQGTILKNPDGTQFPSGTPVVVTGQPAVNWSFDHWEGNLTGTDNPQTLYMTCNKTILANFSMNDIVPPQWRNQGQNKTIVPPGDSIKLYAQGKDETALDWAWLATNESGVWEIFSGLNWWGLNWNFSKKIVINHTLVQTNLTNFPVMFKNTSSNFAAHAQADGDDFVFVDSTNTTQYHHEIDYYNSATGELMAWVNIPFLSSTQDTIVYLYYGNPSCSNQQNIEGTWNSGYKVVNHMDGATWSQLTDSTANHWNITSAGGSPLYNQNGKLGKAVDFHSASYLKTGNFRLPVDQTYTASAWVYVDGGLSTQRYIFEGDSSNYAISLSVATDGRFWNILNTNSGMIDLYSTTYTSTTYPEWNYVCTRVDTNTNFMNLFVNGVSEGSKAIPGTVFAESEGLNIAANKDNSGNYMYGLIDEIRVSNVARNDSWIQTEYNMMSSPGSFMSFEWERMRSGGAKYGSPISFDGIEDQWAWSNFTWKNASIAPGRAIGWKIYYIDSSRNQNVTNVMSFTIPGTGYTLTVNIDGNGQVLKNPDMSYYAPGTPVELTAIPAQGWTFSSWSGNLNGNENPKTIIMDGNKVVTAHFTPNQYTLSITIDGSGSVLKNPDQPTYTYGTPVELTAVPALGWSFSSWSGDLMGSENPKTIIMNGNRAVTAHFVLAQYTLTVNVVGSGMVMKDPDYPTYTYGTIVELTGYPSPGYWHFDHWEGDVADPYANPTTITMHGNEVVTAYFLPDELTLAINVVGQGTVLKDPDQLTYHFNDIVQLTAIPEQGWQFDHWDGDLQGNNNPENILIDGNKAVTAYFTMNEILLLDGNCVYGDMTPVNDVALQIKNLNTGGQWQASTVDNYYSLNLNLGTDVTAGQTLRYISRDGSESVNVTDHLVTAGEITAGAIHLDFTLRIHYRDLKSFPWYLSQVDTGAMTMKMMMDYLMWNSTTHPASPPSVYDEQILYDTYKGSDGIINGSELCSGLNAEVDDYGNGWIYGYFFAPFASTNANDVLKQICIWLDYPVNYYNDIRDVDVPKQGHPNNVPIAIPAMGSYNNWMVVRGIHTDKNAWLPPTQLMVYGFWLNDPKAAGLGANTYVTSSQFLSTYFQQLSVPGDAFNGQYLAITDPYQDFDQSKIDNVDVTYAQQKAAVSPQEANLVRLIQNRGPTTLKEVAKNVIVKAARTSVQQVLQYETTDLPALFAQATLVGKPMYNGCWTVQFTTDNVLFTVMLNKDCTLLQFQIVYK